MSINHSTVLLHEQGLKPHSLKVTCTRERQGNTAERQSNTTELAQKSIFQRKIGCLAWYLNSRHLLSRRDPLYQLSHYSGSAESHTQINQRIPDKQVNSNLIRTWTHFQPLIWNQPENQRNWTGCPSHSHSQLHHETPPRRVSDYH